MFNPPRRPFRAPGAADQFVHARPMQGVPIKTWHDLSYWSTGEWQVVNERLAELTKKKVQWCPGRDLLFNCLDLCPFERTRVVLVGQDPYPNPVFACGLAFSIPKPLQVYPPTLAMILKEAQADVPGFTYKNGDLTPWCEQGVLLLNAFPSCEACKSSSHNWPEWEALTGEILNNLSCRECVFAFLGSTAKRFEEYVLTPPWYDNRIIHTSHPSPRGNMRSQTPFLGSHLFSRINAELVDMGKEPINWRL